jgi:hypothetical protein
MGKPLTLRYRLSGKVTYACLSSFLRSAHMWLVITALFGQTVVAREDESGRKYALLVGVRHYDPIQLRDLPYAEQNAQEMATVLKQKGFRRVVPY